MLSLHPRLHTHEKILEKEHYTKSIKLHVEEKLLLNEFPLYFHDPVTISMRKIWLLFTLLLAVAILVTFVFSFHSISAFSDLNSSNLSAVIISKAIYVSLRAEIYISPFPNSTMTITFPNGSQKTVTTSYNFEVFLPKTAEPLRYLPTGPENIYISNEHPIDAQVIQNITNDTLSNLNGSYSKVSVYWFEIQGNGSVSDRKSVRIPHIAHIPCTLRHRS